MMNTAGCGRAAPHAPRPFASEATGEASCPGIAQSDVTLAAGETLLLGDLKNLYTTCEHLLRREIGQLQSRCTALQCNIEAHAGRGRSSLSG